ncbi:DNA-binding transcriptional ArsR family regulator [Streptomyces auratus]
MGCTWTNLSNHLRVLREAGVVETEPCGRYTYYKLRPDAIASLAGQFADLADTARHRRSEPQAVLPLIPAPYRRDSTKEDGPPRRRLLARSGGGRCARGGFGEAAG